MAIDSPEHSSFPGPFRDVRPRVKVRLPSLMHELIDCRLVERSAPGVWTLKGDVQALLEDQYRATHERGNNRIFIGLRCEGCGVRAITSVVDGRRICSSCAHVSS